MSEQVVQVGKELQTQARSQQWGLNVRAGAECVLVLAECQLLASKPEAMALDLSNSGLPYSTLYANVGHCTQTGAETFRRTGEKMGRVWFLTNDMGKPGGMIESMLKYLDPNQSAARDKRLKLYITKGQEMIDESVAEIAAVRVDFAEWKNFTTKLLRALEEKAAINEQQKIETENTLREREMEKKQKEEELERHRKLLRNYEAKYQKVFEIYDTLVDNLPTTIAGVGSAIAGAAAVGLGPGLLVMGLVGGGMQYMFLDSARQTGASTVQRLEREAVNLRNMLLQLSGEARSIAGLADIIRQALGRLSILQQQIDMFMEFLIKIQTMIKIATDRKDWVFKPDQTMEERKQEWEDADLKKEILSESYIMKTRFLLASKAAGLYNEVSEQFVIPGFNWLAAVRLTDGSDDTVEKMVVEIERERTKICMGAEKLTALAKDELKKSLDTLARDSAESFKKVAPDLWVETVAEGAQ
ncbi:hypothetical protein AAE478_006821 [Parahypoxylon ruwenzoriense]